MKARLFAPWVGEENQVRSAIYHSISRVNGRAFLLKREEKEQFVHYMRLYEAFCGVRVLTYCIMSNHFHILVEIPPKCDRQLSDEALLDRLSLLYSNDYVAQVREHLEVLAKQKHDAGHEAYRELREKFTCRMWDLGLFMKTLKQRFSSWYNKKHGRRGTLWESRFKSVLVENGHAARTMAAYIDLNPVRASMVKDPKDYRWSGYAEALAGGKLAQNGLKRVISEMESDMAVDGWAGAHDIEKHDWKDVSCRYRMILFEDGEESGMGAGVVAGRKKSKGFSKEQTERELKRGGKLPIAAVVACKSRYFVEGAVLGSRKWVNEVIDGLKGNYLPKDRKMPSCKPQGRLKESGLWALRKLGESDS